MRWSIPKEYAIHPYILLHDTFPKSRCSFLKVYDPNTHWKGSDCKYFRLCSDRVATTQLCLLCALDEMQMSAAFLTKNKFIYKNRLGGQSWVKGIFSQCPDIEDPPCSRVQHLLSSEISQVLGRHPGSQNK